MTTAIQVQYRRGTASQVAGFTSAQGEMVVDTTNNRVVVQDGSTAGGWPAAKLSEVNTGVNGLTGAVTIASTGSDVIAASGSTITIGAPGGFLNKFRNGTMDVWQRGTSAITVTTAGAYTADGWIVTPAGASCTAAQASNNRSGANTLYGLQLTGATGVTDIQLAQRIESNIAAALAGKTVTVQAQVYNNTGASITPTLTTKYASSTDNWTSPTADLAASNLQACANGAWTLVSYTLSVSVNAAKGYEFIFDFGNNFSTTGKDVVVAELDVRVTPGVSTGLNASPPPPELRPIWSELGFCQRYVQTSFSNGVTPANGANIVSYAGVAASATVLAVNFIILVHQMRVTPTMTFYSGQNGGTSGDWDWWDGTNWHDSTPSLNVNSNATNIGINLATTGLTVPNFYRTQGNWLASAEL